MPPTGFRDPIWERQNGESRQAFAAFAIYRNMPPGDRSMDAAYCVATGRQKGTRQAPGTWTLWQQRWRWTERARAHDVHMDAVAQQAEEDAARVEATHRAELRAQQRDRELALGDQLLQRVEEMLRVPVLDMRIERDTETGHVTQHFHPAKWRLSDTAALARVGVELRRLGLGLTTDSDRNDLAGILARVLSRTITPVTDSTSAQELTDADLALPPPTNGRIAGNGHVTE